jgi:hypothetical protein
VQAADAVEIELEPATSATADVESFLTEQDAMTEARTGDHDQERLARSATTPRAREITRDRHLDGGLEDVVSSHGSDLRTVP